MKKVLIISITAIISIIVGLTAGYFIFKGDTTNNVEETLPKPEISEGIRGEQFGIDKNINESKSRTIKPYSCFIQL